MLRDEVLINFRIYHSHLGRSLQHWIVLRRKMFTDSDTTLSNQVEFYIYVHQKLDFLS
ncbi:unnamed protein product [Amoebophrya sp. A25]|nr:unnamed protein product [Amoebophrya sp. A25]|eukprot:GSA25T00022899001.1